MLTARVTLRDRELLDRLAQHEPLSTTELRLLFFTGARACRGRLLKLEQQKLLARVYPSREWRGGATEALWFISPHGRKMIGAPGRRPPGLSIPDLEHRRAVASFFMGLVKQGFATQDEGLYRWLGEQQAQQGTGPSVRPDGYGRYLLPDGEITFYLEVDRGTETTKRVKDKLAAYQQALAADRNRDRANILLVCEGRRGLTSLARFAPAGPPWVWGTTDHEHYRLLPSGEQERTFHELPAWPRRPEHHAADCLGRRWRQPNGAARTRGRAA